MNIDDEFDRFVREHFISLCRTGCLLCGDRQRAEDATQDALLQLHRHWRRADNRLAYVRRTLVTILIDHSRRPWRREIPTDLPHDRHATDASGTVDDRDELLRVLTRLTPRQRSCVVLRYYQDLSIAQTAEALGTSEGNVKRTTSDAVHALRGLLSVPVDQEQES